MTVDFHHKHIGSGQFCTFFYLTTNQEVVASRTLLKRFRRYEQKVYVLFFFILRPLCFSERRPFGLVVSCGAQQTRNIDSK